MKRKVLVLITILTLTGCIRIDNNFDEICTNVISSNVDSNKVSNSYKYYLPINVSNVYDYEFNQELKYEDTTMYMYVDIVSYYYKNKLNFKDSGKYDYYYKEIAAGDKSGFVGINKEKDNKFFGVIVYNYAKIEFYTDKYDIDKVVANSLIILNSISYNDMVVKSLVGEDSKSGKEVIYKLESPDDSESKFSQYLEEYVEEEERYEELPDE